ncbi:MAG: phage terminase large subunit [Candidatus Omnitrophica bacterium]|nr:phage terminase large subunit [Candidatus Omnitrophota bacterium]
MRNNLISKAGLIRRMAGETSLLAFAQLYLLHHLKYKPSPAHREIYDLLFDVLKIRGKKIAIAAPRGFGKSTLISLIYILYCICYSKEKFIVIFSDTTAQVEKLMENIKAELSENEKLRQDFPEVFEKDGRPKPPRWTKDEIQTLNKIKIMALGWRQNPRGLKFGVHRPTLAIIDDLETLANTETAESREKIKDWYTKSILKLGQEGTNFILLGTVCHPQSLLSYYLDPKTQGWEKRMYSAIISDATDPIPWVYCLDVYNHRDSFKDQQGVEAARKLYESRKTEMLKGVELLWPDRYDYFDLRIEQDNDPVSFASEYQNNPIDRGSLIFNMDEATYWNKEYKSLDDILKRLGRDVGFYMSCDPSLGKDTVRGDYSAIIIIAMDLKTRIKYVIIADIKRRTPDETIQDILNYAQRFRFRKIGIESNGFQELIIKELEKESLKQGIYMPLEYIENGPADKKIQRVQTLQPFIKNGTLQFDKNHKLLIDQLTYFPKAKYDDGPDALEMVFRISHSTRKRIMTSLNLDTGRATVFYNE